MVLVTAIPCPTSIGGVTINTIVFDTASAAAYRIQGDTLTLNDGGAITVNSTVTNHETIFADVILGTNLQSSTFSVTNNSTTSVLRFLSDITPGPPPPHHSRDVKTFALGGSGNGVIISNIGGGVNNRVDKSGTGTWTLSGRNSYTGTTTVSDGVLRLDSELALPGGLTGHGVASNLTLNGGVLGLRI